MTEISNDAHIRAIFQGFRRSNAQIVFPAAGTLSVFLNKEVVKARNTNSESFAADPIVAKMFASAAIEMWHRALHSFAISAGLTITSPVWASVAGYYSSHYVMRGYAHLLGRFMLYGQKKIVLLNVENGLYHCLLEKKGSGDGEHKAYWRFVKQSSKFGKDPFVNVDFDNVQQSDSAHRNKANYLDHIGGFGAFQALTLPNVTERIRRISEIEISSLPIPRADKYPDLESVQIVAYHRIVRFRKYLDELLGDEYRFWNVHRDPSWCAPKIIDFQITEPLFLAAHAQL